MKKKIIIAVVCFLALGFIGFLGSDSEAPSDATTEIVSTTLEELVAENDTKEDITDNSAVDKITEKIQEKTIISSL